MNVMCLLMSGNASKCRLMISFDSVVTIMTSSMPDINASSTSLWMTGVSIMGSISLGTDFVNGAKRVPRPAAGIMTLRTFGFMREDGIINTYGEKGERGDTHGRALKRARGVARERAERL